MSGLIILTRYLVAGLVIWLVARAVRRWLFPAKPARVQPTAAQQAAATDLEQCPQCQTYQPKAAQRCSNPSCPRALAVVVALLVFLFAAPAFAQGGGRYLFELTGDNVVATLEVNGLVAGHWTLRRTDSVGVSFNHWLRDGVNTLRVRLRAADASRSPRISGRAYFLALANGQQTDLIAFNDPQNLNPDQSISFKLPSAPKLKLWQAEGGGNTQGIVDVFFTSWDESVKALAAGGAVGSTPLFRDEYADIAAAYGASAASHPIAIQSGSGQITKVSARPEVSDLSLERVAGTQIYRLARKDGAPLFAIRGAQGAVSARAVLIGWVGNAWRILRRAD